MRGRYGLTLQQQMIAGTAAIVLAASAGPAQAQSRTFNVAAGPANRTIPTFAKQAGVQILAGGDIVRGKRTNSVKGALSLNQALQLLLRGTGLGASGPDSTGIVTIRALRPIALASAKSMPVAGTSSAAGQTVSSGTGEVGTGSSSGENVSDEQEIVVTGTNIHGLTTLPVPVQVISRKDISQGGFATVENLLEAIPQNFAGLSADGRFANEGGSSLARSNNDRVSAVDLRGLGGQSTLSLLNGQRRAGSVDGRILDVSMIPLSIIERVEVVTGGRSAVYGADAVAGVVNFVTRRPFNGAETQIYAGARTDFEGGERLQASQLFSRKTDDFGVLAAYDFSRDWSLDLADVGLLSQQPSANVGLIQRSLESQVATRRHAAFLSGYFRPAANLKLSLEGMYGHRRYSETQTQFFPGAARDSVIDDDNASEQYSVTGGAELVLGGWTLTANALHSRATNVKHLLNDYDLGGFNLLQDFSDNDVSTLDSFSLIANGSIDLGFIQPLIALGSEHRREAFRTRQVLDGAPYDAFSMKRNVSSAFAEMVIPLIDNRASGIRRLELSVAGRYDDYSDFGDTFNHQGGVIFEPVEGLILRGAYSTAFRAPSLIELRANSTAFIELVSDPAAGGLPTPVFFVTGDNPALQPEKATTWSLGFDYSPKFARGVRLSATYFNVRYRDRIEEPIIAGDRPLSLEREVRFPGLVTRNPTPAQVAAFEALAVNPPSIFNLTGIPWDPETQGLLETFPGLVLFDNRTTNIAVETAEGIDVGVDASLASGKSTFFVSANATYTIQHNRRVANSSAAFGLLNEVGKPADFRGRLKLGWQRGPFSAFGFVNYTDGYRNPFSTLQRRIGSFTTMDLTFQLDGSRLGDAAFLQGLKVSFTVENALNAKPPLFVGSYQGVLFDSANANARGRIASLNVVKSW